MADGAGPGAAPAPRFPVPTMPAPPVGVVGLGQLGGSLAAALVAAGRPVQGWDVAPAATVTDLGSVKRPVLETAGAGVGSRFVGGHPMCGTERSGHAAVDPGLFSGARWALCLEPDTELPRWLRVAEVALAVGAEVVPLTAAEHDDAVAAISHVPHLLAAALAAAAADAGPLALALAAGSFRDGTRVIGSDPAFVTAMVEGNAVPTAEAMARVEAKLDLPWPDLIAAGHAVARRQTETRSLRVPVERAALLALGRAGGAITRRQAAFLEGWVPDAG